MEASQKTTKRITVWFSNLTTRYMSKGNDTNMSELSACSSSWQHDSQRIWKGKLATEENMIHVHHRISLNHRKGICNSLDGYIMPSETSQAQSQLPHDFTHMWILKDESHRNWESNRGVSPAR